MTPEIKFCGLTRAGDAELAGELGAAYAGVVFAGGPRQRSADEAGKLLAGLPAGVRRVGVVAGQPADELARLVRAAGLHVVQLHARRDVAELAGLRERLGVELWTVLRVADGALPDDYEALAAASDAVLVDSAVPGQLGGTGVPVDWAALAGALERRGRPRRLVLAGGLRPENVQEAVRLVAPDVVDVSSGVEAAPGIKDPARMTAFAKAVATSRRIA